MSACCAMSVIFSGLISTQGLKVTEFGPRPAANGLPLAVVAVGSALPKEPKATPPATAAEPTMKARRERFCMSPISLLRHLCSSRMDRSANARIGSAAAQIAGHHLIDVLVRWLGNQLKKRNGLHDLAGLAIAALRYLVFDPGLQNRVLGSILQSFDRDDRLAGEVADMRLAGTDSRAVYLDGAGAALRYPAAVFGTRDAELVAQHPK